MNHAIDVKLHDGPPGICKNHQRNMAQEQVLLMTDILICCEEHFKTCFLGSVMKLTVSESIPAKVFRFFDIVILEKAYQRCWRTVIKENTH